MRHAFFLVAAVCATATCLAEENQAETDYLIHCQGCHLPEAVGVPGLVPRMKDFLGFYLHSETGRRFIVQVPGSATANLSDARLAGLMNWLLLSYSQQQLPEDFQPYDAAEVSQLRTSLEPDPDKTRMKVLRDIAKEHPVLAAKLESNSAY